jgi:hypothetical protein
MLINKALKRLLKPFWRVFVDALPSKWHVELDHFIAYGRFPNLSDPKIFSEKIAYRKLYDRDPRMPPLVDKIVSKELMAARFGPDFIIPTLATFESEKEIDFGALPYPCVVKGNHGSGMNIFLKQQPENEKEVRRQLRRFLQYDHHKTSEEWAYSQVHKRLLVEPFIDGGEHGLIDYKFQTFGGRVFAIQVDLDRHTNHRRCVMYPDWTRVPVEMTFPLYSDPLPAPTQLQEMLRYSELIGAEFSYVRVDLYEIGGVLKFSELTFYPGAGIQETFDPPEYDEIFGAQWDLGIARGGR